MVTTNLWDDLTVDIIPIDNRPWRVFSYKTVCEDLFVFKKVLFPGVALLLRGEHIIPPSESAGSNHHLSSTVYFHLTFPKVPVCPQL
jgi:hypothetical protein